MIIAGKNLINAIVSYILIPIVVEIILIIIAFAMRRFIPKMWKEITGNRVRKGYLL